MAELSGSTPTATYIRSLSIDEPFIRKQSGEDEFYQTDALGSTLALTDGSGISQTAYTVEPFGKTTKTGSSTNSFQYTGREEDGTGVYYYRARYYHPRVQRFLSEDPYNFVSLRTNAFSESAEDQIEIAAFLSESKRLNPYSYVGNVPTLYVDPLGLLFGGTVNAGEGYGEYAAQYWADLAVRTGNPLYSIPGALASLWTRKTSDATVATLSLAYNVGLWHKYGTEIAIGKNFRIAPFGNRTNHPTGRWPHYHRGVPDPKNPGNSRPNQGMRRHRPWDTKPGDGSFWSRF